MATRETELPGVGTKHTLDLATGDDLVVVEHRDGHWELARAGAEGSTTPLLQLQPREAAELGRILARGDIPSEDTRKQLLFEHFCLEWVTLEVGSSLVDSTLRESGIRARTGATVIAVLRGEESIATPEPDTRFQAGDTVVLMGQPDQVDAFRKLFAALPDED